MRTAVFWVITQPAAVTVISYRRFGITYQFQQKDRQVVSKYQLEIRDNISVSPKGDRLFRNVGNKFGIAYRSHQKERQVVPNVRKKMRINYRSHQKDQQVPKRRYEIRDNICFIKIQIAPESMKNWG